MKTYNLVLVFLIWSVLISVVFAGGGPENVFLVVNPKSQDSLAIANNYIQLRKIPAGNVFYLPFDPKRVDVILMDDCRNQILKPIFETIRSRRLTSQIDYVIYSSDFPISIAFADDVKEYLGSPLLASLNPAVAIPNAYGSLTGMTYLWQPALKKDPEYFGLHANYYKRLASQDQEQMPVLGFRSAWQFNAKGLLVETQGKNYMLSTMLGVTYGRGNTVYEVLEYLKRSAASDGTHPKGTIYFVKNDDIRSKVRDDLFPAAVKELEKLGVAAKIIKGTVPINRNDVQGAVIGTPDYDWKASGSTILPGAICDNFTSFGGGFAPNSPQTPLTEFLRYGAAGSCGTVTEPFAILDKFPVPMIQVFYAQGCSLAEAFYQAIYSPYQILIVGDPLCRPWANIPKVIASGIKSGDTVKGTITLTPTATTPSGVGIDHFELFVNGSRAAMCKPGETLNLDTTLLPDGFQDLRIVAVEASLIQSQGRLFMPIITNNYGRTIETKVISNGVIKSDNPLVISAESPGSIGIMFIQNSRMVGRISGEKGQVKIEAAELGSGPVHIQAIGMGRGDSKTHVLAFPINVTVDATDKKPASPATP